MPAHYLFSARVTELRAKLAEIAQEKARYGFLHPAREAARVAMRAELETQRRPTKYRSEEERQVARIRRRCKGHYTQWDRAQIFGLLAIAKANRAKGKAP